MVNTRISTRSSARATRSSTRNTRSSSAAVTATAAAAKLTVVTKSKAKSKAKGGKKGLGPRKNQKKKTKTINDAKPEAEKKESPKRKICDVTNAPLPKDVHGSVKVASPKAAPDSFDFEPPRAVTKLNPVEDQPPVNEGPSPSAAPIQVEGAPPQDITEHQCARANEMDHEAEVEGQADVQTEAEPSAAVEADVDANADAIRKSGRRRQTTTRYRIQDEENDNYDDHSSQDEYQNDEDPEASLDDIDIHSDDDHDDELDDSFDNESPESFIEPEDDANSAWTKEAAKYNSDNYDSEEDYSDDDSDDSMLDECADGGEADADGDGFETIQRSTKRMRRKTQKKRNWKNFRKRIIRKDVEPLPILSPQKKQEELYKIVPRVMEDQEATDQQETQEEAEGVALVKKLLVCLLWDFDFRYTLLPHQHRGVLAVAGIDVPKLSKQLLDLGKDKLDLLLDVTGAEIGEGGGGDDNDASAAEEMRRKMCLDLEFVNNGGILLADDMGLGKTVQSLGAAVLRNEVYKLQSYAAEENDGVETKLPTGTCVCSHFEFLSSVKF